MMSDDHNFKNLAVDFSLQAIQFAAPEEAATFPPGVLRQLPALPKPLEYRFVQSNLILRDSEANLIVDVLPDAAPAALKK